MPPTPMLFADGASAGAPGPSAGEAEEGEELPPLTAEEERAADAFAGKMLDSLVIRFAPEMLSVFREYWASPFSASERELLRNYPVQFKLGLALVTLFQWFRARQVAAATAAAVAAAAATIDGNAGNASESSESSMPPVGPIQRTV